MKNFLSVRNLLLVLLLTIGGCANDDEISTLEDVIIDDHVSEKWDGEGIPSWLEDRFFDYVLKETNWFIQSYAAPTEYRIYTFDYKESAMIAIDYERFGYATSYYQESGTVCYTDDGRRVNFQLVKGAFDHSSRLLWSNIWIDENIPQITDFNLPDNEQLGWVQDKINHICKKMVESEHLVYRMGCGIDDETTNVILLYEYVDKKNPDQKPSVVKEVYTQDGKEITKEDENVTNNNYELCILSNTDIFAFL